MPTFKIPQLLNSNEIIVCLSVRPSICPSGHTPLPHKSMSKRHNPIHKLAIKHNSYLFIRYIYAGTIPIGLRVSVGATMIRVIKSY